MTEKVSRLENEVGSKSRRSEQVARSEAECQRQNALHDGRIIMPTVPADGGEGSSPPSFLVLNNDNVNSQLYYAQGLITMWDFLLYKGRIGNTHVIPNQIDDPTVLKIMPVSVKSRYFDDGRLYMSRKIRRRLGKYEKVPGLMQTLTYDPKKIGKREAWASFGKDTRRRV